MIQIRTTIQIRIRWSKLLAGLSLLLLSGVSAGRAQTAVPAAPVIPARSAGVETDVVYGEAGGQSLKLDVYRPLSEVSSRIRPAIVIVHGGGWSGGDKGGALQKSLATELVKGGFVCLSVNYRLVNGAKNRYPAAVEDVQLAVRWARANAMRLGIDPARIGAIGDSAGGHLAALLGTSDTRPMKNTEYARYSSRVACVVDMYAPTDGRPDALKNLNPIAVSIISAFLGKQPGQDDALYRDASPVCHVDKTSAPFLILHGTADPLVPLDQSQRLYDALKAAGVEADYVRFEGETHGFRTAAAREKSLLLIREFFTKHLKP